MKSSSNSLRLSIFSPDRKLLSRLEVSSVTLPSGEGQIQILPGHTAMVGVLETGIISFDRADGQPNAQGSISTGFFEVVSNDVTILAETMELQSEIDVARAKRAQRKSEEMLGGADLDPDHFLKYQLKLQRALIRQQLAEKNH